LWPALSAGATVVTCPDNARWNAFELAEYLERHDCTLAFVGTPLAEELLAMGLIPGGMRYLLTGGDVLRITGIPPRGCTLVNHYGPTEATVVTTSWHVRNPVVGELPPIGRPIRNARIDLRDEKLQVVSDGVCGEIFISGDVLAHGYYRDQEQTDERFVSLPGRTGRWYRTGDTAVRNNGVYSFSGRVDRAQLKIRGIRIEASEIEAALATLPGVRAAAVAALGTGIDCVLSAYLVSDAHLGPRIVRSHLADKLPAAVVPSRFCYGPGMPLTSNGKIDREAVQSLLEHDIASATRERR
jgi:non-ribosomal peptide synthetase component F